MLVIVNDWEEITSPEKFESINDFFKFFNFLESQKFLLHVSVSKNYFLVLMAVKLRVSKQYGKSTLKEITYIEWKAAQHTKDSKLSEMEEIRRKYG